MKSSIQNIIRTSPVFNKVWNTKRLVHFPFYKKLLGATFFLLLFGTAVTQTPSDTISLATPRTIPADDPSQFLTRVEIFNEFQHYNRSGGFNLNQTVVRTIVKIGKRFTTRLDVPFVNNSFPFPESLGYDRFGVGDISFRLLGYKIRETKRSVITASLEVSLNTASTPAQGTGKNMLIPFISYSTLLKDNKTIAVVTFQQANSFSGDDVRQDISFSKIQWILLHYWSKKLWTVVAPELFIDYINGGTSMLFKGRMTLAPSLRMNLWVQANAGLYGDFITRYNWGAEVGCRYFMVRAHTAKN